MRGCIVAIGNFDGVHRGHRRLLAQLRDRAREVNRPGLVLSFDPHPLTILRPEIAPVPVSWPEQKGNLVQSAGADKFLLCEVSRDFLDLTAEQFFNEVLIGRLDVAGLVEGSNFAFGHDRGGDVTLLRSYCRDHKLTFDVVPLASEGPTISSSLIRERLEQGDVRSAATMLGRLHRIRGTVVEGDKRGRQLGFPTANLADIPNLAPGPGVYAVRVTVENKIFAGACHIGPNLTFGKSQNTVEVHLIDFDGDLYGQTIEVDFVERLRGTQRFEDLKALQTQLQEDVTHATVIAATSTELPVDRFANLRETIHQWLELKLGTELAVNGCVLRFAELTSEGILRLNWELPAVLLPTDRFEILFNWEQRLRQTFPEIQSIESSTSPPMTR